MIQQATFTREWLASVAATLPKGTDPKLLEKVVRALSLLEALRLQGLDFIFKGGTALILHFKEPHRFSIDIDIIMPQRPEDLFHRFDALVEAGSFRRWQDDSARRSPVSVPVEHYKFYYQSLVDPRAPEEPILLDVLRAQVDYPVLTEEPLVHPWLVTQEPFTRIRMPNTDSLLGDKLTAFAPKTTGILYEKERPAEIIKQLFDVALLFDVATSLSVVRQSFHSLAAQEIQFRQLALSPADVLDDVFDTARELAGRNLQSREFSQLQTGVRRLSNFILGGFVLEDAILAAAKAAYLSRLLRKENPSIARYQGNTQIAEWQIDNPSFNKLNKLKKFQPEAFYYWYQALALMQ